MNTDEPVNIFDLGDEDTRWMERGLCQEVDPELFFPDAGGSIRDAIAICDRCEVRRECLSYALAQHIRGGVWGGVPDRRRQGMERPLRGEPSDPHAA